MKEKIQDIMKWHPDLEFKEVRDGVDGKLLLVVETPLADLASLATLFTRLQNRLPPHTAFLSRKYDDELGFVIEIDFNF